MNRLKPLPHKASTGVNLIIGLLAIEYIPHKLLGIALFHCDGKICLKITLIYFFSNMATIYVLEYGSYLKVQHQKFQVLQQKKLLFQVPVREVTNIILFGYCHLSHEGLPIFWLASKFLKPINFSPCDKNHLLSILTPVIFMTFMHFVTLIYCQEIILSYH